MGTTARINTSDNSGTSMNAKKCNENNGVVPFRGAVVKCRHCSLKKLCLPNACAETANIGEVEEVVEQRRPVLRKGNHLFRQGDQFKSVYAVRTGAIKVYTLTESGEEQITGFYLPGDMVGVDGLSSGRHHSSAVALDTTSVCEFPFGRLQELTLKRPEIQRYVFQLMAKEIQTDQQMMLLLSKKSAEERMASLLLTISQKLESRHLSGKKFRLPMSRGDIGNYLGLAVETVSRVLSRFQKQSLLELDGKEVSILNYEVLEELGCTAPAGFGKS